MTLRLYLEKVLNNTQNFEIKEFLILNSKTPPSGLGFPPHPLSYIGKLYTDLNESWTYGLTFHFGSRGMLGTLHLLFYLQGNPTLKNNLCVYSNHPSPILSPSPSIPNIYPNIKPFQPHKISLSLSLSLSLFERNLTL